MDNNKDESLIPYGDYCYTWIEYPSKSNNFRGKTAVCPYYQDKTINGITVPWCNFLDEGGLPGDKNMDGWENFDSAMDKLNSYFGSSEIAQEKLSLFLLFDYCKECGKNVPKDEDYE